MEYFGISYVLLAFYFYDLSDQSLLLPIPGSAGSPNFGLDSLGSVYCSPCPLLCRLAGGVDSRGCSVCACAGGPDWSTFNSGQFSSGCSTGLTVWQPWDLCSSKCGGGTRSRYRYSCSWKREIQTENCNEFCYNGGYYNNNCRCPAWRSGHCCESCSHIHIDHCVGDYKECGGSPDNIRCTRCENGYYPGGYGRGCLACTQIANCKRRHCSNNFDQICDECVQDNVLYWRRNSGKSCEPCVHVHIDHCVGDNKVCGESPDNIRCARCENGYYSGGYGRGCLACTQIANCKRRHCSNNLDQVCDECVQDNVLFRRWNSGKSCERINDCDFDNGTLCGWTQNENDDDFDWIFVGGPVLRKGPKNDHTKNSAEGRYLSVESAKHEAGEYSNLVSSVVSARQSTCFEFWSFMYGDGSGHLSVYIQDQLSRNITEIYRKIGDHGDHWNKDSISIYGAQVPNAYKLVIQAVIGTSLADISIDDLSTKEGPCEVSYDVPEATAKTATPTTMSTTSTLVHVVPHTKFLTGNNNCTFDSGNLCGWTQLENDTFNWKILSGPTLGIGPSNDHTRNAADGKYLCIESTPHRLGEYADIASSVLPASHSTCFEFWNFMHGHRIGSLYVFLQDIWSKNMTEIYKKSGDHGNQWNKDSISIDGTQVPHDYRLVIRADIGATPRGDISIDDLSTREGPCTGISKVVIQCE